MWLLVGIRIREVRLLKEFVTVDIEDADIKEMMKYIDKQSEGKVAKGKILTIK